MDQVASKAKSTVEQIGRTILSVPDNFNHPVEYRVVDDNDDDGRKRKKKLSVICNSIIEEQKERQAVRESRLQCLQEIIDHLNLYLYEKDSNNVSYEGWIEALHPDNIIQNDDGSRQAIDHRFYLKDCHHRQLWNEYMEKLESRESTVEARSIEDEQTRCDDRTTESNTMFGLDCWFCP